MKNLEKNIIFLHRNTELSEFELSCIKLINSCKEEAIASIINTFNNLSLDTTVIKELESIQIRIYYLDSCCTAAKHNKVDNTIDINQNWLEHLYMLFSSNQVTLEEVKDIITITIIHEYLHSIREFIFSNGSFENVYEMEDHNNQGLEEGLVDAFAHLIYEDYIGDKRIVKIGTKLDYNYMYKRLAYYVISRMSINDIKWFLTSYMEDEYNDRLKDIFKDHYDEIREIFNDLYSNRTILSSPHDYNNDFNSYKNCKEIILK